jgi:hypothetical protein
MAVGRGHATVRLHVERCQLAFRASFEGHGVGHINVPEHEH